MGSDGRGGASTAWKVAAAAAGAAGAVVAYATLVEPRRVELTQPVIHVRDLNPGLEGLRVALLTDMHAGRLTPNSVIRRAVRKVMEAQPHLIALTGDFADRRRADFAPAFDALRGLWAPLGVYAVPGNHDHAAGIDGWREQMERHPGITNITNRSVVKELGGARLCVAGVDDLEEGFPELRLPPTADRDLTILLAHQPDQAEQARREMDAVDLVISGHTHGGQVRMPGVGPVERKSEIYDEGLRRRPWTQVYTSRGVGTTLLPLRLGARPEAALLTLTGAPRPPLEVTDGG